eukprot:Gb_33766 [translate_table: standard]
MPMDRDLYRWYVENWESKGWKVKSSWGLGKGYIYVMLNSKEATQRILQHGVRMIVGTLAYVQFWTEKFDPKHASQHSSPLWIELPKIPEHLPAYIKTIVKPFGWLLVGDMRGSHSMWPNAKVCVEVDLSKNLPSEIRLYNNEAIRVQKVLYPNLPNCCYVCFSPNHVIKDYPHKKYEQPKASTTTPNTKKNDLAGKINEITKTADGNKGKATRNDDGWITKTPRQINKPKSGRTAATEVDEETKMNPPVKEEAPNHPSINAKNVERQNPLGSTLLNPSTIQAKIQLNNAFSTLEQGLDDICP